MHKRRTFDHLHQTGTSRLRVLKVVVSPATFTNPRNRSFVRSAAAHGKKKNLRICFQRSAVYVKLVISALYKSYDFINRAKSRRQIDVDRH